MVRVLSAILAAATLAASAQPPQDNATLAGNLPAGFYVSSACDKSNRTPPAQPLSNDRENLLAYNYAVQRYNRQLRESEACLRAYAQKAQHDIDWVQFTVNMAVAKANGANPPAPPTAPGNMPSGFYPAPDCIQPDKQQLGAAPDGHDAKAMEAYNRNVKAYNALADSFNACMKGYEARARTDINRIEESARGEAAPAAADRAAAPAVESVTVMATKSRALLEKFAKAFATPTKLTGKIARWESGVCPVTLGQQPATAAIVTQRVKEVAAMVGASVNASSSCTPNIQIIFTTTPQALLDDVRKNDPDYLGYAETSALRDKLATVTRPIQAWYATETIDLNGMRKMDSARRLGTGVTMSNFNAFSMPSAGPGNRDPIYLPDATYAKVTGNRINDGVRSGFNHIIIAVDSTKLLGLKIAPLSDYIAMLALAQLNSLDSCQQLPSIVNMLAAACSQKVDGITTVDLAYLRGLYKMGSDKSALFQQNAIADRMQASLGQ
jgi:hypothetical protein